MPRSNQSVRLHYPIPVVPVALIAAFAALAGIANALEPPPAAKGVPAEKTPGRDALTLDHRVIAEATKNSEIMANLTYLSDIIGPRLTGSEALKRANQWAAEKMRGYGLSNVHLESWTVPVGWERGPAYARIIEPDNGRTLSMAAAGWSPGTNGKVQGDVVIVNAKDSGELAAYKGKLQNAVVLRGAPSEVRPVTESGFDWDAPGRRNGQAGPPAGGLPDPARFEKMMAFRREVADFLKAEGALAVLSDAAKPQGLLNTTGGWRGNDRTATGEGLPSLFVAHEHYALLHRLASRAVPARTRLELDVKNTFVPGPIVVFNTVGEIRGTDKEDEIVVLGAHLDSWDLAQGTTDNGTGSSVVLEAARILCRAGVRPHRTIRFILFTGEEQGIHGSKAYVEAHKGEMKKTSMALVHDLGTGRVKGIGLMGRGAVKPVLEEQLVSLKELGLTDLSLRRMSGSDHVSFDRAGVPGFYCQQDAADYRLTHHSQSDTLDKAREQDLVQGAQVMAVTALRVANLSEMLPRDK
jgi:hypothetical protein